MHIILEFQTIFDFDKETGQLYFKKNNQAIGFGYLVLKKLNLTVVLEKHSQNQHLLLFLGVAECPNLLPLPNVIVCFETNLLSKQLLQFTKYGLAVWQQSNSFRIMIFA